MTDALKLVPADPDKELKSALEMLQRQAPEIAKSVKYVAQIRWASYLSHRAEGFSEAQSLELCKSMQL